jgi:hypothetical protein
MQHLSKVPGQRNLRIYLKRESVLSDYHRPSVPGVGG